MATFERQCLSCARIAVAISSLARSAQEQSWKKSTFGGPHSQAARLRRVTIRAAEPGDIDAIWEIVCPVICSSLGVGQS
jgi:hypothetical protein